MADATSRPVDSDTRHPFNLLCSGLSNNLQILRFGPGLACQNAFGGNGSRKSFRASVAYRRWVPIGDSQSLTIIFNKGTKIETTKISGLIWKRHRSKDIEKDCFALRAIRPLSGFCTEWPSKPPRVFEII
jgi:hypothetical protein